MFFSLLGIQWQLVSRNFRLVAENGLFFILFFWLFAFSLSQEMSHAQTVLPFVAWIGFILAILLPGEWWFSAELEDDMLSRYGLLGESFLIKFCWSKVICFFGASVLPIVLVNILLGWVVTANGALYGFISVMMLLVAPALVWFSLLGSSLMLATGNPGLLKITTILPLQLPILVWGICALEAYMQGLPTAGWLALLGACSLISVSVLPIVVIKIIKSGISDYVD